MAGRLRNATATTEFTDLTSWDLEEIQARIEEAVGGWKPSISTNVDEPPTS